MIVPSALITTVPFAGALTILEIVNVSPSKSTSFTKTSIVTGTLGSVVALSSEATGASFTPSTVTVTVAVDSSPLASVIV